MYFTEQTTQQNCLRFSKGHCNFTSAIHGFVIITLLTVSNMWSTLLI